MLTDFLLARIAEDEALFRAAGPQWSEIGGYMLPGFTEQRALAECEAKRQIVAEHAALDNAAISGWPPQWDCRTCAVGDRWEGYYPLDYPCLTLRLLALPYVTHRDFCEEWLP
jgi:hypothetical protein